MATYRYRVSAVAIAIESPSGTDAQPSLATNAVQFVGFPPALTITDTESGERPQVVFGGMGTVGRAQSAGRVGQLTLKMEVRGPGAAMTSLVKPEVDALLRMSCMAPTLNAASWVYTSLDDNFETGTVYVYTAQKLFKLVGCVASRKLVLAVGKVGYWEWTIKGALLNWSQMVLPPVTLSTVGPPTFKGTDVQIGAMNYAAGLNVRSLTYDHATTEVLRSAAGAPDMIMGYAVTDWKSTLQMEVEQFPLTQFDPYALSQQPQDGTATSTAGGFTLGGAANNKLKLEWGQWALKIPAHADNGGLAMWNLSGDLVEGSLAGANREARISFIP